MMKERAEKVDKLEAEILRYKDKMNDIEFFKSRVEELREDNRWVHYSLFYLLISQLIDWLND